MSVKKMHVLKMQNLYIFLEEEMATHSRILAWRIPWTEESGGLQSMGLQRSHTQMKRLNNIRIYLAIQRWLVRNKISGKK